MKKFRSNNPSVSATNGSPAQPKVPVARLRYLPRYATNPLLDTTEVKSRRKTTRALSRGKLLANQTGEVVGDTALYSTREVDDATFVKVFDAGIQAAFDLTGPAFKVFQLVLKVVAAGQMQKDQILIHVSLATDRNAPLKMSDKTFWRGMTELADKKFIAAGTIPGVYWINPHLFFKGDRLLIVNEYVRTGKRLPPTEKRALPEPQPSLF